MEKDSFASLIELFSSIDVKEKGIEKVYDYLLQNHIINNPKNIFNDLGLTLKRIYKIFSVLKSIGLIQVYDRPMKVTIVDPISAWEKLLSEKITNMRRICDKKAQQCEDSFEQMKRLYNLFPTEPTLPPVEYISISNDIMEDPIEFILNEIIVNSLNLSFAKGVRFDIHLNTKLMILLKNTDFRNKQGFETPDDLINSWVKKMPPINYKMLISQEYALEILQIIKKLPKESLQINEKRKNYEDIWKIKISESTIGNFIIRDNYELLQFSVDPSNYLRGIFISRGKETGEIFTTKFNEMFKKAINLSEYFKNQKMNREPNLIDKFAFTFF